MTGAGDLVTVAELARRVGLSRQVVHRHVQRMEAAGQIEVHRTPAGRVLVSEAAYRRLREVERDPARTLGREMDLMAAGHGDLSATSPTLEDLAATDDRRAADADATGGYRRARAERERVELALKRLQLERLRGELRPTDEVEAAAMEAGRAIARRLDQLIQRADEITAAARRRGADGVREMLTGLVRDLRRGMAEDLAALSRQPASAGGDGVEDGDDGADG